MDRDLHLKELMGEVQSALESINKDESFGFDLYPTTSSDKASSLLEQCQNVVEESSTKPQIRILHHLACSGGTLISKCIAAQPNVYLISEAHPHSQLHMQTQKPQYRPTDIISLSRYAQIPHAETLAEKIFVADIELLSEHVGKMGGLIVLRDHTHVDFCTSEKYAQQPTLMKLLAEKFNVLPLATVRHPIDSYLALLNNGWVHFEPKTFDEYCKRYLAFISHFKSNQIIKYETFIKKPNSEMKRLASKLALPFTESFEDTFPLFSITGDSGRGGDDIEVRERRTIPDGLVDEIKSSENYHKLIKKLKYKSL